MHVDYTCIGNRVVVSYCKASGGRASVEKSSGKEWDQIWIGANIATMVAGADDYGNLKNAALAVKGERIAWLGPAAEGARKAAALGVPVEDVHGLWMTPGLIDCH